MNPNLAEFRGNKEIILKARQLGFTTYIAARCFLDTINNRNTRTFFIAQDETNSKRIFEIFLRFYKYLEGRPEASKITTSELVWENLESSIRVGWAGSKEIGRGGTYNNIHCSEVAFWEDPGSIVAGLFQAAPEDANIFLESTANGVGGYFYEEYEAAMKQESIFTSRFFPWYNDPAYRSAKLVVPILFERTKEEEELAEKYNLDDQQLIWRRNKILELKRASRADGGGIGELGTFPQEYPITPMEAFLVTGATYFDKEILNRYLEHVKAPLDIPTPTKLARELRENPGELKIYKRSIPGRKYLISVDTAEGLDGDGDHDYCSADVFDIDTYDQVCTLHGRWEPFDWANILAELGYYYETAWLVVERNNHGHAVLSQLNRVLNYPRIYFHKDNENMKEKQRKPGIPSNPKTKIEMLSAADSAFRENYAIINSLATLQQLKLYSKLPNGKFGCKVGHDDRVSSYILGIYALTDPLAIKYMKKHENSKSTGRILGYNEDTGGII